jgi:hypothetical protein
MSTDRDTRIVRSWLEEGATALPDRVLDAVRDQLPATHQRRSMWLARRLPRMNRLSQMAVAIAAVIVLAIVGTRFLPGDSSVGGLPSTAPSASPTPTASPEPLNDQTSLDGRYIVGSGIKARLTVAVPAGGWTAGGDWVLRGPRGYEAPSGMAIRFYSNMHLYKDPLKESDGFVTVGPTIDDLASAIASRPGWTASAPSDITIGGMPGKLVHVTIPLDTVIGSDGKFLLFGDDSGGQVWGFTPGQVFDMHLVDVGGEHIVIEAFHYPGTSATDLAAQQAVVDSIEIN